MKRPLRIEHEIEDRKLNSTHVCGIADRKSKKLRKEKLSKCLIMRKQRMVECLASDRCVDLLHGAVGLAESADGTAFGADKS